MRQGIPMRLSPKILVLAAAATVAAAGCTDGYPTQDAISSTAMNADEHIRALNGHLRENDNEWRLELIGHCSLGLHKGRSKKNAAAATYALPTLHPTVDVDPATGIYFVLAAESTAPGGRNQVFEVGDWADAVAFRSHLQQLQRLCADAQRTTQQGLRQG